MAREFSSDEWRGILQLARAASTVPPADRAAFLQSQSSDADLIAEALDLAGQFDLEPEEPLGRANTKVGRFQILEYLGSGGSGEVYAADDPELRRKVAIKIFRADLSASASAEQRFIREARAASALNHPNIVTIYEIVRTDTNIAIVMELVPGQPLRTLCRDSVEIGKILSVGQQVAEALSAAHSSGIVHRDIKPENIMLLPDGRVKVLDFGLARQLDNTPNASALTVPGGIPGGTLRYMSPEHFRSQPITTKSDIFALGLVLSELVSGQHPFEREPGDTPIDVFQAIGTLELPASFLRGRSLPAALESILRAMLAKNPESRPTAAKILATLRECSSQASPKEGVSLPRKTSEWTWAAIALGTIALALSASYVISRREAVRWKFTAQSRLTSLLPENRATAAAISRDSKLFSYANVDGIFVQSLDSSEITMLQGPRDFVVDHLAWSADGGKVIASGFFTESNRPAIWAVPVNGKPSQELRAGARQGAPSPDGKQIAFIGADFSSIGVMDVDGQDAKTLLQVAPEDSLHLLLWSSTGRHLVTQRGHLAFRKESGSTIRHSWSLDVFDPIARKITHSRPNRPDEAVACMAALPPDTIGFIGSDDIPPAGLAGLWSLRLDPKTGRLDSATQSAAEPLLIRDQSVCDLSSSSDGSKLLVLKGQVADVVFVADFNRAAVHLSNLRRLTLFTSPGYPHAWTPDNEQVIFETNREGSTDLYKQHLNRRLPEPILVTPKRGEYLPQMSPDRRYILFASSPNGYRPFSLMRIAAGGGPVEEIPPGGPIDEFRCSIGPTGRCVLRKTVEQTEFVYYDLDPIRGVGQELARAKWQPPVLGDWDISPNGQFVALPVHDFRSATIRVVSLSAKKDAPKEREIYLAGLTQLSVVSYAADGSGWFVALDTTVGRRMYFVDLQGHITFLGDISGWAVPSPDGKKVAFLNRLIDSNVWLLSGQ